jgi:hypothetical protein
MYIQGWWSQETDCSNIRLRRPDAPAFARRPNPACIPRSCENPPLLYMSGDFSQTDIVSALTAARQQAIHSE